VYAASAPLLLVLGFTYRLPLTFRRFGLGKSSKVIIIVPSRVLMGRTVIFTGGCTVILDAKILTGNLLLLFRGFVKQGGQHISSSGLDKCRILELGLPSDICRYLLVLP